MNLNPMQVPLLPSPLTLIKTAYTKTHLYAAVSVAFSTLSVTALVAVVDELLEFDPDPDVKTKIQRAATSAYLRIGFIFFWRRIKIVNGIGKQKIQPNTHNHILDFLFGCASFATDIELVFAAADDGFGRASDFLSGSTP